MKYFALGLLLFGLYLVKRAIFSKSSFDDGSFLGAIASGVSGVACVAASLIIFLVLGFLAL